jgi:hypothetical protein
MPATLEKTEAKSAFADLLKGANDAALEDIHAKGALPVEDEAAETQAEEAEADATAETAAIEAPVEETAAPTSGPSLEWLQFAMEQNVPRELVELARDDKQLEEFVLKFGDSLEERTPEVESKASEPFVKLTIPEDEFDATDPIHRGLKEVAEASNKGLSTLVQKVAALEGQLDEYQRTGKRKQLLEEESTFDRVMDGLQIGKPNSPERHETYAIYEALKKTQPHLSTEERMKRAAYAANPNVLTRMARQVQLDALKEQEGETLSGGPAKPAAKKELTPMELARQKIREANRRAREAGI